MVLDMFDNGWIKVHRKLLDWEWYDDSKIVHLYIHCLLKANHKPNKWRGITIEQGQFISSYSKLSCELPMTVQQIRTALNKLKSTNEITITSTSKYSIISITNWDSYQLDNKQDNNEATSKQQTDNKQVTTNKNDKKEKNDKKKRFVFDKAVSLPNDFEITEELSAWANEKGHNKLKEHLEYFKIACESKGYTYKNWNAGFQKAVRDDWAKLKQQPRYQQQNERATPKIFEGFEHE